jgi:hypothetical protein
MSLDVTIFENRAELLKRANPVLGLALHPYKWPSKHQFICVRPPQALDLPTDYLVGEEVDESVIDKTDLGEVYWYDIKRAHVYKCQVDARGRVDWIPCDKPKFVVDINGTHLPIGAFVAEDEDWTEILDMAYVTEAQLSEAMQSIPDNLLISVKGKTVKKKAEKKAPSLKEILDSIPDED